MIVTTNDRRSTIFTRSTCCAGRNSKTTKKGGRSRPSRRLNLAPGLQEPAGGHERRHGPRFARGRRRPSLSHGEAGAAHPFASLRSRVAPDFDAGPTHRGVSFVSFTGSTSLCGTGFPATSPRPRRQPTHHLWSRPVLTTKTSSGASGVVASAQLNASATRRWLVKDRSFSSRIRTDRAPKSRFQFASFGDLRSRLFAVAPPAVPRDWRAQSARKRTGRKVDCRSQARSSYAAKIETECQARIRLEAGWRAARNAGRQECAARLPRSI